MSVHTNKFEFYAKENEQIDAIIKVHQEKNSVILGLVLDCNNKPVKNAVVKLLEKFETPDGIKLIPLTHAFTDNCGQFMFGPLCPNKKYVLKVWYDNVSVKKIYFDNSGCEKNCTCIESGYNTPCSTYDCNDKDFSHQQDYYCDHKSHSHQHNHDCEHESHSHQHNHNCEHENHSHPHGHNCDNESSNPLEELQKKLQIISESNNKDGYIDDLHLPLKKSKDHSHQHRSRHHQKSDCYD